MIMAKFFRYLMSVVPLAILMVIVAVVIAMTEGPSQCEKALRKHNSEVAGDSVVVDAMWSRSMDNHWISALLLQPKDID